MTESEKQVVIDAVLSALRTNSRTIDQLTPVALLSDNDCFEINGGKKVSYGVLIGLINTRFSTEHDSLKILIEKCELSSVAITAEDGLATLTISSNGKDISTSIPIVSTSQTGLMTSKDKQKLDSANDTAITAKEIASTAKNMAESAISNIGTESSLRANADNELRAAIALLRSSLDNLKESAGNDIDSIYEQLRSLRDHIEDSLSELRPVEVESEEAMAGLIASGEIDDNRMYFISQSME